MIIAIVVSAVVVAGTVAETTGTLGVYMKGHDLRKARAERSKWEADVERGFADMAEGNKSQKRIDYDKSLEDMERAANAVVNGADAARRKMLDNVDHCCFCWNTEWIGPVNLPVYDHDSVR